jgi:thiol-disulfide isomerase/thioredoxin
MFDRRTLFAALALSSSFVLSAPAWAFETRAFDASAFKAAQVAGKPILVDVTATWCPTCKSQKTALSELARKPKFKDLVVFEVDFDARKDLLREFDVRSQSTLISYKGAQEVGRSTGDTKPAVIEEQLNKSL